VCGSKNAVVKKDVKSKWQQRNGYNGMVKGKIFNNDNSGEFVFPSPHKFLYDSAPNSLELSLLRFLP